MKPIYFILLLLISCGGDDFAERSKLGDLRLLALIADSPEVNTATTVNITPVISYVNGGGVALDFTWEACPDPGIDFGAEINCDSSLANLKQTDSGTIDTSTLSGSFFTGATTAFSLNITADVTNYLALLSSEIQFNGLDYLFILTVTDPNTGFARKTFKKIKITSKANSELNSNPTMGSIFYEGSSISAFPSAEGSITVDSLSDPESYQLETNVGLKSFEEDAYISWYTSAGEFESDRTDPDESNKFNPKGTEGVIVAVYRDARGGVAFQLVSF